MHPWLPSTYTHPNLPVLVNFKLVLVVFRGIVGPGAPMRRGAPQRRWSLGMFFVNIFFKTGLGDLELENIEHALLVAKAA